MQFRKLLLSYRQDMRAAQAWEIEEVAIKCLSYFLHSNPVLLPSFWHHFNCTYSIALLKARFERLGGEKFSRLNTRKD